MAVAMDADRPKTKMDLLREAAAEGDWYAALRIAARFPRLGKQKEAITRGWAALQNPGMYREMGQDPEELVALGIKALRERYGL